MNTFIPFLIFFFQELMHYNPYKQSSYSSTFSIPIHMVGFIVGKNGGYIKQIMQLSSTRITIEAPSSTNFDTSKTVIIVGSYEGRQLAQTLIQTKLYEGRLLLRVRRMIYMIMSFFYNFISSIETSESILIPSSLYGRMVFNDGRTCL
jgi:hypothetical protein